MKHRFIDVKLIYHYETKTTTLACLYTFCTTMTFNPWRVHKGYSSRSVYLCVCYRANCYIPRSYIENWVDILFFGRLLADRDQCID